MFYMVGRVQHMMVMSFEMLFVGQMICEFLKVTIIDIYNIIAKVL